MTSFIPLENVRFSKRLTTIEERCDKVVLKFADGEVVEASVLAGSDGIKSDVRKYVLEPLYPNEVDPVYADAYCYRAVIPMSEANEIMGGLTDVAKFYFGHDRSAVTYRITKGEASELSRKKSLWELSDAYATTGVQLLALRSGSNPMEIKQRRYRDSHP